MANREQRGLGKGLSALLGEAVNADQFRKPVGYINKHVAGGETPANHSDVLRIPVEMLEPNPFQPRQSFNQEGLEELAASIRNLGLIQPITVRRTGDARYQIISGERRYRACQMAGMTMIPAYVRDAGERGMLEMAIVENIQRQDLDPIEIAISYQRLIDECSLTQEQMAERVGKKRVSVSNYLRLLRLPVKAQHDLKVGLISVGHAKVILGIDDPATQEELCDMVVAEGLSVRQLESLVRRIQVSGRQERPRAARSAPEPSGIYRRLQDCLGSRFGGDVSVRCGSAGKGSVTLRFRSDAEVEEFLRLLDG